MTERDHKPQLIEQTSKKLKLIRLVGMLLIIAAIIAGGVTADEYGPSQAGYVIGGVLGLAGIGVWGYGMLLSWWNHG